jgi:ABC-type polysaccharide/polyol phosphate transport system ATPase subunit
VASITLRDVFVQFPVYTSSGRSLKKQFIRAATGGRIVGDAGRVVINALRGVTLEIGEGDRVGIVGPNGAGKTTLLRVLAGVYEPVLGSVAISGRVIPLFDLGFGIDPEATGYDNIVLRGTLLGIPRRALMGHLEEIAEFTELGDYMHMPVRTYSTGMYLRLAFAISTAVAPDILLMDEFLAMGDAQFISKAERRMDELVRRAGIMVLASHSDQLLRRLCNKAVWMHAGEVRLMGNADEVINKYLSQGA